MAEVRFSNVAYVILGFLAGKEPEQLSGYDLKQWIDRSVRFFFAASYGQIYPELKKLREAGLVQSVESATGGRARTLYTITPAGHDALRAWLLEPENRIEMRDDGLLRYFFSRELTRDEQIERLIGLRDERAAQLAVIQTINDPSKEEIPEIPLHVLDYGVGLHEYVIDWCTRTIEKLQSP